MALLIENMVISKQSSANLWFNGMNTFAYLVSCSAIAWLCAIIVIHICSKQYTHQGIPIHKILLFIHMIPLHIRSMSLNY